MSNPIGAVASATTDTANLSERDQDAILVARVQTGDVAAFDQLVRRYRERLFGIIYNLCSNREDAADLTQEAFIKAFRSINRFQGKSSFFTWLYRIAVNTALSHLKKHRARRFFSLETVQDEPPNREVIEALSIEGNTDKGALISELQERLNEAFQRLSLNHRTVVVLFEVEGLSHQEIADIVGCSVGTVRSRLHYAKRQLQADLHDFLN